MNLDLDHLREVNVKRCEEVFHHLNAWTPPEWAMCAAGEMGEVCGAVKKLRRLDDVKFTELYGEEQGKNLKEYKIKAAKEEISKEIADTIIYLDLLAAHLGINLSEAIVDKFNEVSAKNNSMIILRP